MFAWLSANLINIVLVAVLVLIVGLLLRGMIRDKKAGKTSCGANCASCGACSRCVPLRQMQRETLIKATPHNTPTAPFGKSVP